jgi:hypothetical protein
VRLLFYLRLYSVNLKFPYSVHLSFLLNHWFPPTSTSLPSQSSANRPLQPFSPIVIEGAPLPARLTAVHRQSLALLLTSSKPSVMNPPPKFQTLNDIWTSSPLSALSRLHHHLLLRFYYGHAAHPDPLLPQPGI